MMSPSPGTPDGDETVTVMVLSTLNAPAGIINVAPPAVTEPPDAAVISIDVVLPALGASEVVAGASGVLTGPSEGVGPSGVAAGPSGVVAGPSEGSAPSPVPAGASEGRAPSPVAGPSVVAPPSGRAPSGAPVSVEGTSV